MASADQPEAETLPEFSYSARQREAILMAVPLEFKIDPDGLMAKLTMAARIAVDPKRGTLERPSPAQTRALLRPLKSALAELAPRARTLLAVAGVDVDYLSERIDALTKCPPRYIEPHQLTERRRNFVINVCQAVWSTTTTRWPLRAVKDSSPLLRLAEAALPKELQRLDSRGGDAPDFVEVGEAGIAVDHAMRRQRAVQRSW